jgi:ATP-dependent helicase HrpA
MALQYKLLGEPDDLRSQIVTAAADRAFAADGGIRTQAQFAARAGAAWRALSEEHNRIAEIATSALAEYYELSKSLAREFPPLLMPSVIDMRQHLARLVPKDFVTATPREWLPHLPRFMKGIGIRLTKLTNAGLLKDQQGLEQVLALEQAAQEQRAKHAREGIVDGALVQYLWMLEEFRVSVFAQELRTSVPVSPKRLTGLWVQVRP